VKKQKRIVTQFNYGPNYPTKSVNHVIL